MAKLITDNMKPAIKAALAAKFLAQLNVKMPRRPDLAELVPDYTQIFTGKEISNLLAMAGERYEEQRAGEKAEKSAEAESVETDAGDIVSRNGITGNLSASDKKRAVEESRFNEESRKREEAEKSKAKSASRTRAFTQVLAEQTKAKARRKIEGAMASYRESMKTFNKAAKDTKDYFTAKTGDGNKFVDKEVEKINTWWEELTGILGEVVQDTGSLFAQLGNPEVIVTGTAAGFPNPASKILLFMDKMKKILSELKRAKSKLQDITDALLGIGLAAMEIVAFAQMFRKVKEAEDKTRESFSRGVAEAQKRKDWVCDTYDSDEDSGQRLRKTAGYMVPRLEVDYDNMEMTLLGYRCYCTVSGGNFIGAYRYGGGEPDTRYGGTSGQRCYYITAEQMEKIVTASSQAELAALYSSTDNTNASFSVNADGTTTLRTNDGRVITIDKEVSSGDTVQLNTGEVISVM